MEMACKVSSTGVDVGTYTADDGSYGLDVSVMLSVSVMASGGCGPDSTAPGLELIDVCTSAALVTAVEWTGAL